LKLYKIPSTKNVAKSRSAAAWVIVPSTVTMVA
jgi:hypothetical protein